jgi:hypothetical protein
LISDQLKPVAVHLRNLHFTREKTRQRAHLNLKPSKRDGLEEFSRTKEDEMTAATFDHQVGKSLEFFEQQRNEKTACDRDTVLHHHGQRDVAGALPLLGAGKDMRSPRH